MKGKNSTWLTGTGLLGLFLVVSEVFLAVRFVLHFFAVNPTNGFASWIFNSTNSIMMPFRGVFPQTVTGHPHFVDLQTLFVMASYVVAVAIMVRLFDWGHAATVGKK